jgi:hypothetical protein
MLQQASGSRMPTRAPDRHSSMSSSSCNRPNSLDGSRMGGATGRGHE